MVEMSIDAKAGMLIIDAKADSIDAKAASLKVDKSIKPADKPGEYDLLTGLKVDVPYKTGSIIDVNPARKQCSPGDMLVSSGWATY